MTSLDHVSTSSDEVLGRTVLGRYRIVKRLARGGMGVVYLARTEGAAGFTRPAVVKRILPDLTGDNKMTQMFVREARIMSYLNHPGIVGVLDFGEEDGAYIMVLEYVHGFHLGRWYRYVHAAHGFFPAGTAIHIMVRVLEALHYAHSLTRPDGTPFDIVHRDISPSNILLDVDGNIKLADFGIARVAGETQVFKTEETTVKGKFPYLAPEVFTGNPATMQTDLYSCGVVLHELLLGRNDFRGREIAETIHRVFTHTPSLEYAKRPDVPRRLEEVLHRAIAKNPSDRYATAGEFAEALRAIQPETEQAARATLTRFIRRDFLGDMPAKLGCEPLTQLDDAWRHTEVGVDVEFDMAPEKSSSSKSPGHRGHGTKAGPGPTDKLVEPHAPADGARALHGASDPGHRSRGRSKAALAAVGGVALILIAGGLTFGLTKRGSTESTGQPPRVIVVQQEGNARQDGPKDLFESVPPPELAPQVEEDVEEEEEKPTRARRAAKPRATKPQAQDLSSAFRAQKGKVHACYQQNTKGLQGTPEISIRFSLDTRGVVRSASLSPSAIQGTPLGACLLRVAKQTEFGPQAQEVTFRIPIQAQFSR